MTLPNQCAAGLLAKIVEQKKPKHLFVGDSDHDGFANAVNDIVKSPVVLNTLAGQKFGSLCLEAPASRIELMAEAVRQSKSEIFARTNPSEKAWSYYNLVRAFADKRIPTYGVDMHQDGGQSPGAFWQKIEKQIELHQAVGDAVMQRLDHGLPINNGWDKQLNAIWTVLHSPPRGEHPIIVQAVREHVADLCADKLNIPNPIKERAGFEPRIAEIIAQTAESTVTIYGAAHMELFKHLPEKKLSVICCHDEGTLQATTILHMLKKHTPDYYLSVPDARLLPGRSWQDQLPRYNKIAKLVHELA